ncbi:hypothetical protein [Idiomarina xiamenensis]|uniref:Intracellular septation protein A n=1 Tax=Idiomarina xiamenensis 10-D-4 TaxID=740709 RepID=K2KLL4_9GAMM|nr:hypothetical protein [Idiomarina xiamenensis]EKE83414.1 hypothetical protein A10D4_08332 [Idiomarina xiamenensis 10-D-4]
MPTRLLQLLLTLTMLLYPLLVWSLAERQGYQLLAVLLLLLLGLQIFLLRHHWQRLLLPASAALFVIAFMWVGHSDSGVRFYPVWVNAGLLLVFFASWCFPPAIITRLAVAMEGELPAAAIAYTRNVTLVWCGFFLLNGSIAAYTAAFASVETWALYNGLLSYVLMGLLFAIEFGVRHVVKRRHHH